MTDAEGLGGGGATFGSVGRGRMLGAGATRTDGVELAAADAVVAISTGVVEVVDGNAATTGVGDPPSSRAPATAAKTAITATATKTPRERFGAGMSGPAVVVGVSERAGWVSARVLPDEREVGGVTGRT
jgi:hypothetical protein